MQSHEARSALFVLEMAADRVADVLFERLEIVVL